MSELDVDGLLEIIDPLLYAVSHDLKAPLLTLSLSADLLLGNAEPADDGQRIAIRGLTEGSKEMERMIDSPAVLSRAYRKSLDEGMTPLTDLLVDIECSRVAVDGRVVRTLLEVLRDEQADAIVIDV